MTDSPPSASLYDARDFTPVPLARTRFDGWLPARQRMFIEALAAMGTVDAAARAVGMSRMSAYKRRRRPGAESFAAAWDRALDAGRARMFDYAMERAMNGVTTLRLRLGGVVDIEHGPDRRLVMSALRTPPPQRRSPKRTECI